MPLSWGFVQSKVESEVVFGCPGHQEQSRAISLQVPPTELQEGQRQPLDSLVCTEWEEESRALFLVIGPWVQKPGHAVAQAYRRGT